MSSSSRKLNRVIFSIYCFLLRRNCCSRFERNSENDIRSVSDSSLNTSGMICCSSRAVISCNKWIVMIFPSHHHCFKATTNIKTFNSRKRKHSFCQICFHAVKDWLSKACWNPARNTGNNTSKGVSIFSCFFNSESHFCSCIRIRTPSWVTFDFVK